MTYQAYLNNIQAKTGKSPEDFKALAARKGYLRPDVKAGEIVSWLKQDFGLGQGHAMAIVLLLKQASAPRLTRAQAVDRHFAGQRSRWRAPYDRLVQGISKFGPDVSVGPNQTYINLLRGNRKFGILQVTANRMDVGIKRKGVPPQGRFQKAGTWNSMMTHRVRIADPKKLDSELLSWLRQAYESV